MRQPSVKGELLEPLLEEIHARLEDGSLGRERLEVALEPWDVALLEDKLDPQRWYPMASWGRLVELLAASGGGDRRAALLERGALAARTLLGEAGSVDSVREEIAGDVDAASSWVAARVLHAVARQHSCGRWTWVAGPAGSGSYEIEVESGESLPDCLRIMTEALLRRLHSELGVGDELPLSSDRPASDRLVFTRG